MNLEKHAKISAINATIAALTAEMHGMLEENKHRLQCDNSIAYGEEQFFRIANELDAWSRKLHELSEKPLPLFTEKKGGE